MRVSLNGVPGTYFVNYEREMFLVHSREESNGENGDSGRGRDILTAGRQMMRAAVGWRELRGDDGLS